MSDVNDDLVRVRALIDTPEKWNQGGYFNDRGGMCMMGAFDRLDISIRDGAWTALRDHLPEGPWESSLIDFNDDPETSHADILALFDRAIAASA